MNYQFQYPQAFWLLTLIPFFILIFFIYQWQKKNKLKRIGDHRLVNELYKNHSAVKSTFKIFLLMIAFACGCIAVANPRQPDLNSGESRAGIDIVIALDVSRSMLAKDVAPDRLSKSKQFISKLIDRLQNDRTGLVLFAGNSYIRSPLTFDPGATKMFVSVAHPDAIGQQGTNISDALTKSLLVFDEDEERFGSIILITDGETHDDESLETVKAVAEKGIMINTVGIGSEEGATLIDSAGNVKEDGGQVVVSKLNEQILKQLAAATNGTYVRLQSSDDAVEIILNQFSEIEKKALGDLSTFTYKPFYAWLAIPMLLLLIAEIFLPDRKKIR